MIRVLHVVQSLDPAWGGIARVLPDFSRGLAGQGVASIIATLSGGRYGAPPDGLGVELRTFAASPGALGWSPAFGAAVEELVRRADVVHLHGLWTDQNRVAGRAARRLGRPLVVTPHSMMMPWAWRRSWWKKRPIGWWFEHRNLRSAARIHALSAGEEAGIRALGFNERIVVIPNGVDPAAYRDPPAADALLTRYPELAERRWKLFLARIHPQKGIVPLLQACMDLALESRGWQLVLAGRDEVGLNRVIAATAERKGLADRVTFVGVLSRDEVRAALGRAELLLQPSFSEGLSLSILEALASGVPVLISPACNMPEVAAAGAGVIVEPQRGAIAAGLRPLLCSPRAALCEMGRRGRRLVAERFAWDILLPRYRAMYDDVISGR